LSLTDADWHRTFFDPIPLPDGGELRTLRDAGNFIAKLPQLEQDASRWQAKMQALLLVAKSGGDLMPPRVGMMKALYPAR
jgi:hypothetical protein